MLKLRGPVRPRKGCTNSRRPSQKVKVLKLAESCQNFDATPLGSQTFSEGKGVETDYQPITWRYFDEVADLLRR